MRIKYLVFAGLTIFLLAACNVVISTSGDERTTTQEPTAVPAEETPEPTETVSEDDHELAD